MGYAVPNVRARAFLPEIHRLRGLTMLGVVILHAFAAAARTDPWSGAVTAWTWIWSVSEVLFHDATTIFVVISGLLFMRVYASLPPLAYWRRRMTMLALPYVLMTAVFTPIRLGRPRGFGALPTSVLDYPAAYLHNLVAGSAQYSYWFLPVALFTVCIAPLVARLVRSRLVYLGVALALLAPLLVAREGVTVSFPTIVYFGSAFVVGAVWGAHYHPIGDWLRRFQLPLAVLTVGLTVGLYALYLRPDAATPSATALREHLFWVQKLALAGVLAVALTGVRDQGLAHRVLSRVGEYSFGIYFLHSAVQHVLGGAIVHFTGPERGVGLSVAVGAVVSIASLAICLGVIELLLAFAPAVARWFLGAKRPRVRLVRPSRLSAA